MGKRSEIREYSMPGERTNDTRAPQLDSRSPLLNRGLDCQQLHWGNSSRLSQHGTAMRLPSCLHLKSARKLEVTSGFTKRRAQARGESSDGAVRKGGAAAARITDALMARGFLGCRGGKPQKKRRRDKQSLVDLSRVDAGLTVKGRMAVEEEIRKFR